MAQHRILNNKLVTISDYQHLYGITTIEPEIFHQQAIIELTGPFAQDRTLVQGSYASEWIESAFNNVQIVTNYLNGASGSEDEVIRVLRLLGTDIAVITKNFIGEDLRFDEDEIMQRISSLDITRLIEQAPYPDISPTSDTSESSDEESAPEEEQPEEIGTEEEQQEERPFYIGVHEDLSDRDGPTPPSVMISKISHAQYDIGLTQMSPNRFNQLTTAIMNLNDDEYDDTSEDYMYLVEVYETLGNLEYALETMDRPEVRIELDSFARIVSQVTEDFEVTEEDAPVGWNAIRPNLEAIDIESLIRRHDGESEQEGGGESPDNNVDNLPDYDNDAFDIVNRIQTDMDYMNQFFPDDPDGLFLKPPDPSTHVFFEGDKVKVNVDSDEVTEYVDVSNPGYSNSIGTIVDPRKVDFEKRVYYGMFPEQYEDDFAKQYTYPFRYTEKTGHTVKLIHNMVTWGEPRERDNFFREMMETTPEINQYYIDMNIMWDESEEGNIYTFNKSTSNNHDVSMLMEASEPHKRSYLVEWNDDGIKKLSVFSALALHPRSFIRENPV